MFGNRSQHKVETGAYPPSRASQSRSNFPRASLLGESNQSAVAGTQSTQDVSNIRVVIHEVDPPLPAMVFRAFMHIVCALMLAVVLALGVPRALGIHEFNVLTGSMTPTYPVGTLVFAMPCEPTEIAVGDVVSCVMNENLDVITHRVVANDAAAGTITTRGDANNSDDAPTLYANVLGVVRFSVPYVGGIVDYVTNNTQGRITGIVALACIVALTLLSEGICNQLSSQTATVIEED